MEVFERSMFEIGGIKSALFIQIISLKVACGQQITHLINLNIFKMLFSGMDYY